MLIYELKNTKTGEIFEKWFKNRREYEEVMEKHPHLERYYSSNSIHFQDSISLGYRKPPKAFQDEVLGRIKRNNPHHNMKSRWD